MNVKRLVLEAVNAGLVGVQHVALQAVANHEVGAIVFGAGHAVNGLVEVREPVLRLRAPPLRSDGRRQLYALCEALGRDVLGLLFFVYLPHHEKI